MEIGLRVLGKIEVDDDVDGLDIDAASQEIGTDEVAADTVAEIMEDAVAVGLKHLGVRVETGIAEICDLLCEKLDTVRRVTEYNRLVDLKLKENLAELSNSKHKLGLPWRKEY
jgi:hypothetical protein